MKKVIKKILGIIRRLDNYINFYKKATKNVYLPSEAYVNWAIALRDEGRIDEAIEKLEFSTKMIHKTPNSFFNLGKIYLSQGNYERGIYYLKETIKLDPFVSRAYVLLASSLSDLGEVGQANYFFKKAKKLNDRDYYLYLKLGKHYIKQNRPKQAIENFKIVSDLQPLNEIAPLYWGMLLLESGDIESSIEKFCYVLNLNEKNNSALKYLCFCYFEKKDYRKVIDTYGRIEKESNIDLKLEIILAQSFYRLGQIDRSFDVFSKVYNGYEKELSSEFFLIWGRCLTDSNLCEEASIKYDKALELACDKEKESVLFSYAINDIKLGNEEIAKEKLKRILQTSPQDVLVLYELGRIYYLNHRINQALEYFLEAKNVDSNNCNVVYNIAQCYLEKEDFELAKNYLEKALKIEPYHKEALYNLSILLMKESDYQNAERKLSILYKIDKKNVKVYILYAKLYIKLGMERYAIEKIDELLEFDSIEKDDIKEAIIVKTKSLIEMNRPKEAIGFLCSSESQFGKNDESYIKTLASAYTKLAQINPSRYNVNLALDHCKNVKNIQEMKGLIEKSISSIE